MATVLPISLSCTVIDANVMVALCAGEPHRYVMLVAEIENYARAGSLFYALNIIVGESLYALLMRCLCAAYALRRKLTDGVLNATEHV